MYERKLPLSFFFSLLILKEFIVITFTIPFKEFTRKREAKARQPEIYDG